MRISELRSLIEDDQLFMYAFRHAVIGMAIVAPDGKWLMVNEALCKFFGLTEKELLSTTFQELTHPEDLASDLDHIQDLLLGKHESYQKEKRYIHKEGDPIHALLSVALVRDETGTPQFFVSQIQDMTERKILEEELVRQAHLDPLTGLCNRRCFTEQAVREITRIGRYQETAVVLMLDIDHFKKINDTYGHGVGDDALKEMVSACSEVLRPFDIFGRIGGEEFAVLLIKAGLKTGKHVAERLRQAVEKIRMDLGDTDLTFTVSIGGTVFRGDNKSLQLLMQQADEALYEAKAGGRNRVIMRKDSSCDEERGGLFSQGFIRLEWHDEYESGNHEIDSQHRALFVKANQLLSVLSDAEVDSKSISQLLDELLADVSLHFAAEEAAMVEVGYPHAKRHAKIHAYLLEKAQSFAVKFQEEKLGLLEVLQYFAIDVIHDHILKEDIKFFPYMGPELYD